jgi:hypothetical protein
MDHAAQGSKSAGTKREMGKLTGSGWRERHK